MTVRIEIVFAAQHMNTAARKEAFLLPPHPNKNEHPSFPDVQYRLGLKSIRCFQGAERAEAERQDGSHPK